MALVCVHVCVRLRLCQLTPGCLLWRLILFSEAVPSNGLAVYLSLLIRITAGRNDSGSICVCVYLSVCVRVWLEIQDEASTLGLLRLIGTAPWSISSVSHVSLLNLFKCAFLGARVYVCVRGRPHRMRWVCLCFVHRLFGHAGLTRSCRACSCVYGNCFMCIHIYARHVSFLRARVSVLASWEKRPKGDGLFVL